MKVLITGGDSGQLKWELKRTLPEGVELVGEQSERLDICDAAAVNVALDTDTPECIINAAAYTAVDKAESESDQAYKVNETGVQNLCSSASQRGIRMIHISTDFVFGQGNGSPFLPDAPTDPVGIYGLSKLAGEKVVTNMMGADGLVIRTAWVYSSYGQNFVKTMLRVMKERDELGVVADQIGSPTWANGLARALWRATEIPLSGIQHWTGMGVASWYDFAEAIYAEGLALGLLNKQVSVNPLRTDQYPTPAQRPAYSVMEITKSAELLGLKPENWRAELKKMMSELA